MAECGDDCGEEPVADALEDVMDPLDVFGNRLPRFQFGFLDHDLPRDVGLDLLRGDVAGLQPDKQLLEVGPELPCQRLCQRRILVGHVAEALEEGEGLTVDVQLQELADVRASAQGQGGQQVLVDVDADAAAERQAAVIDQPGQPCDLPPCFGRALGDAVEYAGGTLVILHVDAGYCGVLQELCRFFTALVERGAEGQYSSGQGADADPHRPEAAEQAGEGSGHSADTGGHRADGLAQALHAAGQPARVPGGAALCGRQLRNLIGAVVDSPLDCSQPLRQRGVLLRAAAELGALLPELPGGGRVLGLGRGELADLGSQLTHRSREASRHPARDLDYRLYCPRHSALLRRAPIAPVICSAVMAMRSSRVHPADLSTRSQSSQLSTGPSRSPQLKGPSRW